MDVNFDFEIAITNVKSKKTQKYLKEVLSTYYNHEYRSCIVMLYAATFADALEKINTMAEIYQNEKASDFLKKYEEDRAKNTAYSTLERDVKKFIVQSGIINDVEEKQWEHLKDYRDYCAHPVVEKDYELISPNGDQVRMHIRNMFEALFLKDAILTNTKLFDEFLQKVESFYDRNELEGMKEYVTTRYISRLNFNTKGKFIKNLWKFAFFVTDDECDTYRRIAYHSLIWIIESDKVQLLQYMEENANYFNGKIDFSELKIEKDSKDFRFYKNKSTALMYFLYRLPEVYEFLSEDNKMEIRAVANKNANLLLMSLYLFDNEEKHVEEMQNYITGKNYCLMPHVVKDVCRMANKRFVYSYNDLMIYYFLNCQNSSSWSPDWDYINATYRDIMHNIFPLFTQDQMSSFIEKLSPFYTKATCFKEMAKQIVYIVEEKGFSISFDEYDINLKKYV